MIESTLSAIATGMTANALGNKLSQGSGPLATLLQKESFAAQYQRLWHPTLDHFLAPNPKRETWLKAILNHPDLTLWFWQQYVKGRACTMEAYQAHVAAVFREKAGAMEENTQAWSGELYACFMKQCRTDLPTLASLHVADQTHAVVQENSSKLDRNLAEIKNGNDQILQMVGTLKNTKEQNQENESEGKPFWGRQRELGLIYAAIQNAKPIQILGYKHMGKSRLLRQVYDTAALDPDFKKVFIEATTLEERTPKQLLNHIVSQLKERDDDLIQAWWDGLLDSVDAENPSALLNQLVNRHGKIALFIDDADELAKRGHTFDEAFFNTCSSLCDGSDPKLLWISSSVTDINDNFEKTGLCSQFLRSSFKLRSGALTESAVETVHQDPELQSDIFSLSGGCPETIETILNRLNHYQSTIDDEFKDQLYLEMVDTFKERWQSLSLIDQNLLKKCTYSVARNSLSAPERLRLMELVNMGLASKNGGHFKLAGSVWQQFVSMQNG